MAFNGSERGPFDDADEVGMFVVDGDVGGFVVVVVVDAPATGTCMACTRSNHRRISVPTYVAMNPFRHSIDGNPKSAFEKTASLTNVTAIEVNMLNNM